MGTGLPPEPDTGGLSPSLIVHLAGQAELHLRSIRRISFYDNPTFSPGDIALGQADNFIAKNPSSPLQNLRGVLTTDIVRPGEPIVTFAYPGNNDMDFSLPDIPRTIVGDYFAGTIIRFVTSSDHADLPYPHYESTIPLGNGARGGPVFNSRGRIIGVNCAGWHFGSTQASPERPSYIVPVRSGLALEFQILQLPNPSREESVVPPPLREAILTLRDIGVWGHIDFQPPLLAR